MCLVESIASLQRHLFFTEQQLAALLMPLTRSLKKLSEILSALICITDINIDN